MLKAVRLYSSPALFLSSLFTDLVPLAPDGPDVAGGGGVDLQLFPQVPDVDRHGALRAVGLLVPDAAIDASRREDLAGALHEELEDLILPRRERDGIARTASMSK